MRSGGGHGPSSLAPAPTAAALVVVLSLLGLFSAAAVAQYQPPAQTLTINGKDASTWQAGDANVVQLDGPVTIELDGTRMTARQAVVWLRELRDGVAQPGEQKVTVALIGEAEIRQPRATRTGQRLIVTARVNGSIRITADNRTARDLSDTATFRLAVAMREEVERRRPTPAVAPPVPGRRGEAAATRPAAAATRPASPVLFLAERMQGVNASDGKVAVVLNGRVAISRQDERGDRLEMQADRAVLFTTLERLRDLKDMQQIKSIEQAITAGYLEGDVRVTLSSNDELKGEQRLEAERVYYEFSTDRAVLTDAVLHTVDPQRQIPVILRAQTVRQLSEAEYTARDAELTTSGFAVPSYSIRADTIYVRQEETGIETVGTRTDFSARHVTLRAFDLPFFYLPAVGGSMGERGLPLRSLSFGNSDNFGTSIETRWGLLETLGQVPPRDFDASFTLDYFSERGPAGGIDATYAGGFISQTTRDAWNFEGEVKSYFVYDEGVDDLGRRRAEVEPPQEFRGRVSWEHQHFFPEDWQLQVRAGWLSDATFREEWFENEYNDDLPLESSLYLKRQHDTEAITFLATVQPNDFVTTSDLVQEQFEIERLPELGYHRIGDSFARDRLTFFSDNTVSILQFKESDTSVVDQGFRYNRDVEPGRPSLGLAGVSGATGPPIVPEETNIRGDFRQEVDYPIAVGQFKVVPYVMGRYIGYEESVDGARVDRAFAGTGVRINTQFWKIDNTAKSELFDVYRVRHVVEPAVHLFASATNVDPDELFIYDEPVDNIHDVQAAQFAVRQRWQTKRGGPGRLRSVDFLTLDVEANFFGNQPSNAELGPIGFRGLFFDSIPEASIPRNSINAQAEWRMSDTTILISDAQYNLDVERLATASIGLVARRDTRMTYYLGLRYIEDLDSSVGTIAATYELTRKYSIGFRQSYDFRQDGGTYSSLNVQRKFDRFFMAFTAYNDSNDDEQGIGFSIYPEGLAAGASSDALGRFFGGGGN